MNTYEEKITENSDSPQRFLKTTNNFNSNKSYSTDISHSKEILLKSDKSTLNLLNALNSPELKNENFFNLNQPLFQNLYNMNQMRKKFLGYKMTFNEIKNKECPLALKILILKSLRNNFMTLIKQNKQLIKEKKRCQQITFEENLSIMGQNLLENNKKITRKSFHKKNASTTSHFKEINKSKSTHPKQSSQHTLISNQSTNDGNNAEEEKFIENLKQNIDEEEEKLIEIKNFLINLSIQLEDVKEDLQFEKAMLFEKQKKVEEKTKIIENIKNQVSNMSKKRDFFKRTKKPAATKIQTNNLNSIPTNRDLERSMTSINTSRMNSTFMDDFSQGFNAVWNKLLSKFHSTSKNKNILDSISGLDKPYK